MPESPLIAAGAQVEPVSAAPLNTNRFFTGWWSNRSPLRDAATPYLYEKFYSATRYDSIIRGSNMELTTKLSLILRPGNDEYNPGPFPPINRLFEFRSIVNNAEQINLLASCDPGGAVTGTAPTVRDVTGPANNRILWTKDPKAGRTSFLAVGNTLYFSDGVDAKKMLTSGDTWMPDTAYNAGQWIVDENGNIQQALGTQSGTIVNIEESGPVIIPGSSPAPAAVPAIPVITIFLDPTTPITVTPGTNLTFAGLTTSPALNGLTKPVRGSANTIQYIFEGTAGDPAVPFSTETGTISTGTGISGATEPFWNDITGGITNDGGLQWVCRGPNVQDWQPVAPTSAPLVTQAPAPSIYPNWAADTWYAPLFIIEDSNNNLQQLTQSGTAGASAPAWATSPIGAITHDGSAQWTLLGASAWVGATAYALNAVILATYTYYITITVPVWDPATHTYIPTQQQKAITVTSIFQCVRAGISSNGPVNWVNGLGTTTGDGTVTWKNMGQPVTYADLGVSQKLSIATTIIDSNSNLQKPSVMGKSGDDEPTAWATDVGSATTDGSQHWINAGAFGAVNTDAWIYAYSYQNDIDNATSTASPRSVPITLVLGNLAIIQGVGTSDMQGGKVILWRTVQGGSTLLYLDTIPNPGGGNTWVYTDTTPDTGLNEFIVAPTAGAGAPPPAGFRVSAYHLGRVWGFVGATLYYSQGPDAFPFNGNTAFSANNNFPLQAVGILAWPTSIGLVVFTTNGSWVVLGQGTSDSPLYIVPYQDDIALTTPDCFARQGSTGYLMDSSKRVISLDPGAGELEIGFPVADYYESNYDPANTWLTWHRGGSSDTALFVADGTAHWARMLPIASPEAGNVWSVPATIGGGGVRAIASVETSSGVRSLILGPAVDASPILKRNLKINNDDGTLYGGYVDFGSIVIAQPGTQAGVQYIVGEVSGVSVQPQVGILMDEAYETPNDVFQMLRNTTNDPPNQEASVTIPSTRFYAMQSGKTVQGRHVQVRVLWEPVDAPNELFSYTIYGRLPQKARK
jgi:hypothetical protein